MKKLLILSLVAGLSGLTGCASSGPQNDNPIVTTNFQLKENASFARNAMFLAGSSKFVDSEKGGDNTRKVAGSSLKMALNIFTLNFSAAIQDSMMDSLIENEPLARRPLLLMVVPTEKLELSIAEQVALKEKALTKYKSLLSKIGFKPEAQVREYRQQIVMSGNSPSCDFVNQYATIDNCNLHYSKGKILRVASYNGRKIAVIGFNVGGAMKTAPLAKVMDANDYLYIPSKSSGRINYGMPAPVVIHDNKVHRFVRGADESQGLPLNTLDMTYRVDDSISHSGNDEFFKMNMETMLLEPIK